jgi:KDO2-lipid IV(A) lauroyltransferase
MWHHLLLMVCEIAWAQRRLHLTNWSQHVRFRNQRDILSALLSKRPAVMVTGHFGNFEVSGYVIGLMGVSTTTIARRLDNRFLHRWVERFRGAKGQHMVDKEGCAPIVEQHLKAGGVLTILADQHAGDKGCWTQFMGVPASCHKALALFSLSSKAPMLAGYTIRLDGKPMKMESACLAIADPATDDPACDSVTSLTQWYNARLEESVALAVEQYWWLHRRWRRPPRKVAKRLEKRAAKRKLAA